MYGEKYSLLINEFQKDNIIVFDTESIGVDVTEDEIIQIAAIKVNKNGEVIEKFEKLIRNNKSVKRSKSVHGFSDEFLKQNGEKKEVVLKEFVEFSNGALIVGHNVQYDIIQTLSEIFKVENKPSHDAMDDIRATKDLLVKALNKDIMPTSLERVAYMSKYLKPFTDISNKINTRRLYKYYINKCCNTFL